MDYQEGDIVLCKVTNIVKTTVFVETLDGIQGSIVLSEIAPGRIRNLRAYVVPNKLIVCKVLSIRDNHLFLSLRRVKSNEQKEVMEEYKKEKTYNGIIKTISGEKSTEIIKKINSEHNLVDFLEQARENPKILSEYFSKEESEKLAKILSEKKTKEKEIKKEFTLSCKSADGIIIIKNMMQEYEGISYLGNSKFVIIKKALDLKKADNEITEILQTIEKESGKNHCIFAMKK